MTGKAKSDKHILLCSCKGDRFDLDKLKDVRNYIEKLPAVVVVVSDLCGVAVTNRESLCKLIFKSPEWLILGCHKRTMSILLEQIAGTSIDARMFNYINMINTPTDRIFETANNYCSDYSNDSQATVYQLNDESGWPSWYPVIDYTRCSACGQCAEFCLFGVYEKTVKKVNVVFPQGCKNLCAACAHICPSTAIIFPKYKNGGAIGGSEEIGESEENKRCLQHVELLQGKDLHAAIQERKLRRKSIIREEVLKKAFSERDEFQKKNKNE